MLPVTALSGLTTRVYYTPVYTVTKNNDQAVPFEVHVLYDNTVSMCTNTFANV